LDDQITPTLQFSALYKSKIASAYSSLPEYVYKRGLSKAQTIGRNIGKSSHALVLG
jgi:hypothetical protein